MKKLSLIFVFLLLFSVFLIGCGQAGGTQAMETAETTPEPSPEPTPEPIVILGQTLDENSKLLDLSMMTDADLAEVTSELPKLKGLETITLSDKATVEDFITIAKSAPDAEIDYTFELFGQEINTLDTERLEYKKVEIGDEGLEQFREVLPYLPNLKYLSFDRCGTTDEACAQLRDDFPDTEVVWRIYFGSNFTCMTDAETIWASCDVRNENCDALKYCTKLKNLDLGHNAMNELGFLQYMPELKVLILSCSEFDDLSNVAYCKNLTYFECAESTYTKDISAVAALENLEQINIGNTGVRDFTPLYGLKHLKRIYIQNIYDYSINMQDIQKKLESLFPNAVVDCGWYEDALNCGHWRYKGSRYEGGFVPEYQEIRDIFGYDYMENSPYRVTVSQLD